MSHWDHIQGTCGTLLVAMLLLTALRRVQGGLASSTISSPISNLASSSLVGDDQKGSFGIFSTLRTKESFFGEMDRMRQLRESKLVIVSDFDRTITSYRGKDGSVKGEECHDIIFKHADNHPDWVASVNKLWDDTRSNFGPFMEMSEDVKEKFCDWWWSEANSIIHKRGLTRDAIRRAAQVSDTVLRPGFAELVKQCRERDVPFVVVSAGFADVIEGILEREGIDTSHVVVHANRMRYDAEGVIAGFDGEMVHSRNKALFSKHIPPHLESTLSKGTRMIVMGDKVNDLDAVKDLVSHASLKVGFATSEGNEDELLERYDVVVPGDGPMHHVIHMLDLLLADPSPTVCSS